GAVLREHPGQRHDSTHGVRRVHRRAVVRHRREQGRPHRDDLAVMTRPRGSAVVLAVGAIAALVVVARSTGAAVPAGVAMPHTRPGSTTAYVAGAPRGFSGGLDE